MVKAPTAGLVPEFSARDCGESDSAVGASLTLVMVMVKACSKVAPPWSVVWTRTEKVVPASKLKELFARSVVAYQAVNREPGRNDRRRVVRASGDAGYNCLCRIN